MVLGRWYFLSSRAADAGTGGLAALGIGGLDVQQSLAPDAGQVSSTDTKALFGIASGWNQHLLRTIPHSTTPGYPQKGLVGPNHVAFGCLWAQDDFR